MIELYFLDQTIGIFGRFWPSVPDGVYLHVLSFCIEPSAPLRVQSTHFAKGYIQMEKNIHGFPVEVAILFYQ
jgi:hypothetical protein